jgi:hypothetical protein
LYDIDYADHIGNMYLKMLQVLIKRWASGPSPSRSPLDDGIGFTIRFAYPDDDAALRRLAALDSQQIPAGPLLVAEVSGGLWAAVSLTGEPRAIADPFQHTAELLALLRHRADRLARRGRHQVGLQPAVSAACS